MRPLSLDSGELTSPTPWTPPAPEIRALQALVRRHSSLQEMLQTENNRLGAARVDPAVERSLQEHIAYLEAEVKTVADEIRKLMISTRPCEDSATC